MSISARKLQEMMRTRSSVYMLSTLQQIKNLHPQTLINVQSSTAKQAV